MTINKAKPTGALTFALPYPTGNASVTPERFFAQLSTLAACPRLKRLLVMHQDAAVPRLSATGVPPEMIQYVHVESWWSGVAVEKLLEAAQTDILLLMPDAGDVEIPSPSIERFVEVAQETGAGLIYSDWRESHPGGVFEHPAIDYQLGSLRETFDFGSLVFISREAAEKSLHKYGRVASSLRWAGFYDLRLKISVDFPIVRIPEGLYVKRLHARKPSPQPPAMPPGPIGKDARAGGLHPADNQREVEGVANSHLQRIGAYLSSNFSTPPEPEGVYPVSASVIIPVRNREKTIAQAVESALKQKTSFIYNIIVVDDQSTDSTTQILSRLAQQHKRLVHKITSRTDLGIGGLWNEAIYSPECGLFAIQLDSDDVYSDELALEKIVSKFWDAEPGEGVALRNSVPRYGMVIGSFKHVNFNLEEIPPGVMEHRELSGENGHNNALRLDGVGAPRAFYTPLLRHFGLPNSSFGEDYAVGLRLSRDYEIGRIFEPLYLARQWEGNTGRSMPLGSIKSVNMRDILPPGMVDDPQALMMRLQPVLMPLMIASKNRYNAYKDWLRSVEIQARQSKQHSVDGQEAQNLLAVHCRPSDNGLSQTLIGGTKCRSKTSTIPSHRSQKLR